jgi:hypothetical protein
MVRIDREVLIFDQDLACLEARRGVEGRIDDVEGACRIRQRAIGGRLRVDDLGLNQWVVLYRADRPSV